MKDESPTLTFFPELFTNGKFPLQKSKPSLFKPQDFKSMFGHFSTLWMKELKYNELTYSKLRKTKKRIKTPSIRDAINLF